VPHLSAAHRAITHRAADQRNATKFSQQAPITVGVMVGNHHHALHRNASRRRAPLRSASPRTASQRSIEGKQMLMIAPIAKQSKTTYAIYELLKKASDREDKTVVYSELVEEAGKPIRCIRGNIYTAANWLRRTDKLVLENLTGVGYRIAKDADHAPIAQKGREQARRRLKVVNEKLDCTNAKVLTPEQRASHAVEKSSVELALLATRPRTISNIKQMSIRKNNALDEQELLEAVKAALMKE
jgi:hypothetical protein